MIDEILDAAFIIADDVFSLIVALKPSNAIMLELVGKYYQVWGS